MSRPNTGTVLFSLNGTFWIDEPASGTEYETRISVSEARPDDRGDVGLQPPRRAM